MDMDYRLNIENIEPAWTSCKYKLMVRVKDYGFDMKRHLYITETLQKWFGAAEYFWNNCYLCELKK